MSETDKCRALIRKVFSHSPEYHNYIETKLAGDFACELALITKLQQLDIQELAEALDEAATYFELRGRGCWKRYRALAKQHLKK